MYVWIIIDNKAPLGKEHAIVGLKQAYSGQDAINLHIESIKSLGTYQDDYSFSAIRLVMKSRVDQHGNDKPTNL